METNSLTLLFHFKQKQYSMLTLQDSILMENCNLFGFHK